MVLCGVGIGRIALAPNPAKSSQGRSRSTNYFNQHVSPLIIAGVWGNENNTLMQAQTMIGVFREKQKMALGSYTFDELFDGDKNVSKRIFIYIDEIEMKAKAEEILKKIHV